MVTCMGMRSPPWRKAVPSIPWFLLKQCPRPRGPQGSAPAAPASQLGAALAREADPCSATDAAVLLMLINRRESLSEYNNGKKPGAAVSSLISIFIKGIAVSNLYR